MTQKQVANNSKLFEGTIDYSVTLDVDKLSISVTDPDGLLSISNNGNTTVFECKYSKAGIANAFRYLEGIKKLLAIAIEVRYGSEIQSSD